MNGKRRTRARKRHEKSPAVELLAQHETDFRRGGVEQHGHLSHAAGSVGHEAAHEIKMPGFPRINGGKQQQREEAARKNKYETGQKGIGRESGEDVSQTGKNALPFRTCPASRGSHDYSMVMALVNT